MLLFPDRWPMPGKDTTTQATIAAIAVTPVRRNALLEAAEEAE
jgi:hypothetical protein